ncbi:SOS response-associated peptidase [Algicella marina]|uniref:SOS response-associated peptidase n=1 Tax=Algicella marina TaxID=2683284 RepID=UPI0024DF4BAA|nr:SOS response-associated peptidase family protein [Algicella marina]
METARKDAAPGEEFLLLSDSSPELLQPMRWGMVMSGRRNARGRPVMETIVNARSETVFEKSAFEGVRRAVLPVSGWYEWTGKTRRKQRWRMSVPGQTLLIAAIFDVWHGPGGVEVAQFATLTVAPNTEVEKIHHRMPALLSPGEARGWLTGMAGPEVLRPAAVGLLTIEAVEEP